MKKFAQLRRRWMLGAIASVAVVATPPLLADQSAQSAATGSPSIATPTPTPPRAVQYHEHRVGGRLERVTITRANQLTEVYRNRRADTIWAAEENEIGETPNMRQWIIGSW